MPPDWANLGADLEKRITGPVMVGAPLDKYTTWRIGGPADLLAVPRTAAEARICLEWAGNHEVPVSIIGNGSNLLVLDGGIRGLVVRTAHGLNHIEAEGCCLNVGAGVLLPTLVGLAARRGWEGMDFCAGIPATVGGAVMMNAGVGEETIGKSVYTVGVIDKDYKYRKMDAADLVFGYRYSSLQQDQVIITDVTLRLTPGDPEAVAAAIEKRMTARREKQPHQYPSAGSVFKNPPGGPAAGWLIEQAGAKGLVRGGAMVSWKHANFLVNKGGASAADVLGLMEEIVSRVRDRFGVELEREIHILGEARG